MALNANAFVDLDTAKTYLKIPLAELSQDSIVELWINAASDYLESATDRRIKEVALTQQYHGKNTNILLLDEWPIAAIPFPQVWVDQDSNFGAPTLLDPTTYRIGDDGNSIVLLGRLFPNGFNNIQVAYTAGYATIPADLQNACLWLVTWYHRMRENQDIGRTGKSKGGETTTIMQSAPDDVKDAINRYKRCEFVGTNRMAWSQ